MPAFTFEKISPPGGRGPPIVKKQRGLVAQMLDSFAAARAKKSMREEQVVLARNENESPD